MQTITILCGLLVIGGLARSETSGPATGPSGTVCESAGGSCSGIADGTNIRYEGNCSKYIVCFLECGCDMDCPADLHFNSKLQVCDWPEDAGCDPSYVTPSPSTPGGSGSGSTPSPSTPGGSGSSPTPSPSTPGGSGSSPTPSPSTPGGCGSSPTPSSPATGPSGTVCESAGGSCKGVADGTKIPYKGDCNKYVVCFLECGCDMGCPAGLNFNSKLQVCDWPEDAGCDSSYVTTSKPTVPTPSSSSTPKPTTVPTPSSSSTAKTTTVPTPSSSSTAKPTTVPTPSSSSTAKPTTVPTPSSSSTAKPTTVPTPSSSSASTPVTKPTPSSPATGPSGTVCESAGGSCSGIADGTNIRYEGNCSKYIVCFLECGCDMDCPADLHFNSKLQVCDWPEDAGCDPSYVTPSPSTPGGSGSGPTPSPSTPGGSGSGPTPSPSTPGGSGSSPTPSPSTPGGSGSSPTPSSPATGPSGTVCESAGGSCKGVADGTKIPYKGDCNKYVVCFLECGCDMGCPAGLNFNSKLQVCDWPEDAGCTS